LASIAKAIGLQCGSKTALAVLASIAKAIDSNVNVKRNRLTYLAVAEPLQFGFLPINFSS
ncbi:MAG: hypothetical protein Q8K10_00825, partial [Methylobacter sp.]|nr:hypothetical protein [Methylobacter sp.]